MIDESIFELDIGTISPPIPDSFEPHTPSGLQGSVVYGHDATAVGVFFAARGEAKQLARKIQRLLEPRKTTFTRQASSRSIM